MSEMIEQVAVAIQKDSSVDGVVLLSIQTCRLIAITAITAMREPTAAMIEAEPDGDGEYDKTNSAACAKAFWQAMIDTALEEKP